MKKFIMILISIVGCIILFWVGSIISCEIITAQHGQEFENLYMQTNMIDEIDYLKVMEYSDSTARVYFVKKHEAGDMITFEKQDGQWQLKEWETIWSHYGSADGLVWPYIR